VALDAARANVPTAARVFLCDGWPDTASAFPKKGKPKKYEWIVSNPPVHRGQPDDFRVVRDLISGARYEPYPPKPKPKPKPSLALNFTLGLTLRWWNTLPYTYRHPYP